MSTIDKLTRPDVNLDFEQLPNGNMRVSLNVPKTSGDSSEIPFLEVTKNGSQSLVSEARRNLVSELAKKGFTFGPVEVANQYDSGGNITGKVPGVGKASFEIRSSTNVSASAKWDPSTVSDAVNNTEKWFDEGRNRLYDSRDKTWVNQGGATIDHTDGNGKAVQYKVTPAAAAEDYNSQGYRYWNGVDRLRAGNGQTINADLASAKLDNPVSANDFGERGNHFNQALSAANGNADVAAAVLRSSAAAGHNPKDDINVVVSNKDGALIATQGVGPGANRAEPVLASHVQPGTAQNVAEALAQKSPAQQVATLEQQPERQQQAPRTM
jgi:hypothetical protein